MNVNDLIRLLVVIALLIVFGGVALAPYFGVEIPAVTTTFVYSLSAGVVGVVVGVAGAPVIARIAGLELKTWTRGE